MNGTERKRLWREKCKKDTEKMKVLREKEKERGRKRRELAKQSRSQDDEARSLWREQERARKRRTRIAKKQKALNSTPSILQSSSPLGSYKCQATLRKAVVKTSKSMPESPLKRQAVLLELVRNVMPALSKELLPLPKKKRADALAEKDKMTIKQFYEKDEISRAAPGRKDTISIKDASTGVRVPVAKRHMIMSVAEAYQLFKEQYNTLKIDKSKFFELRPQQVRPMNEMPHNVCVCVYNANYYYLVESLHKNIPNFPKTPKDLIKAITCNVNSEECMTGRCNDCLDISDVIPLHLNKTTRTSWKQWIKSDNLLQVATIPGTLEELLTEIQDVTGKFKQHVYVKDQQADHFEKSKSSSTSSEVVLQIDYAENFSILAQDEIQSAHWSHPQATLFTGCSWGNAGQEKHSFIVVSNEMVHDKFSVWVNLKTIIESLKKKYPNLKKLQIFSDGCAGQFKNRFTLSLLCSSQSEFGVEIHWNFFATSHGKGAVDGVGAVAKRMLWSAIMTRKDIINTCWDCFVYLKGRNIKGMEVLFVAAMDIQDQREALEKKWELIQPIPYLQKHHFFKAHSQNSIFYKVTATSTEKRIVCIQITGNLRFDDVYSSTTSDEEFNLGKNVHGRTPEPLVQAELPRPGPSSMDNAGDNFTKSIALGTYVLVKIVSGYGNKAKKEYKYVAVCQGPVEVDGEVKVMFLKSISGDQAKIFRIDEDDVSYVNEEQIIKILQIPEVKGSGNRVYYEFSENLDIFEH